MADTNTLQARLDWHEERRFTARFAGREVAVDGDNAAGVSPMGQLLIALGGCMGIDIVDILGKMRTPPESFAVELHGDRAEEPPRRFVRLVMTLRIGGDVPLANVERAVALSRDRYCSVWKTLDPDTPFDVDIEISPPPPA